MDYRIKLLKGKYQRDGLGNVALSIAQLLVRKMSPLETRADWKRRRLGESLHVDFDGEVRYGAFRGLRLPKKLIWAKNDMSSILIGFYEKQVIDWITSRQLHFLYVVDIGSADGLYLAGILKAGLADSAVGFESSRKGRESSNEILRINNVQDRAVVMGTANSESLNSVLDLHMSRNQGHSLLLCDIEGGEVDLFDSQTTVRLYNFFIVIELHEWSYSINQLEELINLFKSTHDVQFLYPSGRNPDSIPELQKLTDDERWNVCSEGRRASMRWLVCTPLGHLK
jgi:hypothetical protein